MAKVMSKVFSSSGSGDVLASIRKLVADEAQQGTPPTTAPVFRSSVRTPDPATVPFRHTNGARDWLVGAIDEEKRTAGESIQHGGVKPLALKRPIDQNDAPPVGPPRDWKPRISLALVNPVEAQVTVTEALAAQDMGLVPVQPEEEKSASKTHGRRFQPWKQDAMSDGFARFEGAHGFSGSKNRLLLTPDFRVPGPGEPANFNTPAPHSKPRFTLKPADAEGIDHNGADRLASTGTSANLQNPAPFVTDNPSPRDTMTLNEEMLRDVVADVVREELRGALGERITRNVRKLVRSEINRAVEATKLTEQDEDQDF